MGKYTIIGLSLVVCVNASAGVFLRVAKIGLAAAEAPLVLAAAGFAGAAALKRYCAAGAPVVDLGGDGQPPRPVRLDCSRFSAAADDQLGAVDERIRASDGPLQRIEQTLRSAATKELRRALNAEQVAAGMPPDPDDCDAHHIVPKAEARPWAIKSASAARALLRECNIDLDSTDNGVYLPSTREGGQCQGSYHKNLHTARYYEGVGQTLARGKFANGCDGVRDALRAIKQQLVDGAL